jgi:hypothetical protein
MKIKKYSIRLHENNKWYIHRIYKFWPISRVMPDTFYVDGSKSIEGCVFHLTARKIIAQIYKGEVIE